MNAKKIALVLAGIVVVALFLYFDLQRFLTLAALKANRQSLLDYYADHKLIMVAGFMALYIVQTALSLPGAAILSLAAGAIFGSIMGTVYANIAATIGATLAFLVTRYLLRDVVLNKFGSKLEGMNRELETRGFSYLLFLRLVPDGKAGQWVTEERDLLADYRLLFGADPQEAEAIAIMTDTDNTRATAKAWYGEISLATEGK